MTRFRIDLGYDGSGFHGWAAQDDLRTVQGTLESWIGRVLRIDAPPLGVAGRTDAGVHARGQVAHVDLETDDPEVLARDLHRYLARALPSDLVVTRVSVAPSGFDARFSAVWRRYIFRLTDAPGDPLWRHLAVAVPGPLDLDAMNEAGAALLGLNDFAAWCKRREGATTIRTLLDCHARRVAEGYLAGVIEVEVRADAFCHSMVRSLVGSLVAVGQGRRDQAWITSLLTLGTRAGDVTVLPPQGLTLAEVGYPADEDLATRAQQARARRDEGEHA